MPSDRIHKPAGLSFIEAGLQSSKRRPPERQRSAAPSPPVYEPVELPRKKKTVREITFNALLLAEKELIALMLRIENVGGMVPDNISQTLKEVQRAIRVNQGAEEDSCCRRHVFPNAVRASGDALISGTHGFTSTALFPRTLAGLTAIAPALGRTWAYSQ